MSTEPEPEGEERTNERDNGEEEVEESEGNNSEEILIGERNFLSRRWWTFAARAFIALIFGFALLTLYQYLEDSQTSLKYIYVVFYTYAFMEGLLTLPSAISRQTWFRYQSFFAEGFFGVLFGSFALLLSATTNSPLVLGGLLVFLAIGWGLFRFFVYRFLNSGNEEDRNGDYLPLVTLSFLFAFVTAFYYDNAQILIGAIVVYLFSCFSILFRISMHVRGYSVDPVSRLRGLDQQLYQAICAFESDLNKWQRILLGDNPMYTHQNNLQIEENIDNAENMIMLSKEALFKGKSLSALKYFYRAHEEKPYLFKELDEIHQDEGSESTDESNLFFSIFTNQVPVFFLRDERVENQVSKPNKEGRLKVFAKEVVKEIQSLYGSEKGQEAESQLLSDGHPTTSIPKLKAYQKRIHQSHIDRFEMVLTIETLLKLFVYSGTLIIATIFFIFFLPFEPFNSLTEEIFNTYGSKPLFSNKSSLIIIFLFGILGSIVSNIYKWSEYLFNIREATAESLQLSLAVELALARLLTGGLAALIVYIFLLSGLLNLSILQPWMALAIAFTSGFSDRFILNAVDDMLRRVSERQMKRESNQGFVTGSESESNTRES